MFNGLCQPQRRVIRFAPTTALSPRSPTAPSETFPVPVNFLPLIPLASCPLRYMAVATAGARYVSVWPSVKECLPLHPQGLGWIIPAQIQGLMPSGASTQSRLDAKIPILGTHTQMI